MLPLTASGGAAVKIVPVAGLLAVRACGLVLNDVPASLLLPHDSALRIHPAGFLSVAYLLLFVLGNVIPLGSGYVRVPQGLCKRLDRHMRLVR